MKNTKVVLLGILLTAVALSGVVAPAAAQFVHTRGILITMYPQQIVVFYGRAGNYGRNVAVIIKPPWYFVEDLMGFDTVTLTLQLVGNCYQCRHNGEPPKLLGADSAGRVVVQLGGVTMGEDDNGAFLVVPITFVISPSTGRGYYMLYLSAEATANGAVFRGWDQVGVAMLPGAL